MMHDVLVKEDPSLKPPGIGRLIYQAFSAGKEYGTTEGGVTAKLRRSLKGRSNIPSGLNRLHPNHPDNRRDKYPAGRSSPARGTTSSMRTAISTAS
jgi:hypothetical protein